MQYFQFQRNIHPNRMNLKYNKTKRHRHLSSIRFNVVQVKMPAAFPIAQMTPDLFTLAMDNCFLFHYLLL